MNHIFSKIDNKTAICSYISKDQASDLRSDLCSEDKYIQISLKKMKDKAKVKAHKHNKIDRLTTTTQEAWIVIEGKLKAEVYDLDDSVIQEIILSAGDCIAFFSGGHSLEAIEEGTIFYEFKNGPYYGVENDKQFI